MRRTEQTSAKDIGVSALAREGKLADDHAVNADVGGASEVDDDRGMTTAEYAVGTIAAVAFAVGLYKVVSSGAIQNALRDIIVSALHSM